METVEVLQIQNGTDVILTLLYAGGSKKPVNEEIVGNTRLVKLLFLLQQETSFKKYLKDFTYIAYNYGPFSSELFDSLQALINAGLVRARTLELESYLDEADRYLNEQQTSDNDTNSPRSVIQYSLTRDGQIVGSALYNSLNQTEKNIIIHLKKTFNSISLKKLLRYIYVKYPDFATESEIKDYIY